MVCFGLAIIYSTIFGPSANMILHLKCSSLIFQFPINPINVAHFGRSLPDVLATCEAFDTVGKDDSMFIILDPRMSSKPPNSFFNESAASVEVLLMIQESVNHHLANIYIHICQDTS